jgi:hypothetical protein
MRARRSGRRLHPDVALARAGRASEVASTVADGADGTADLLVQEQPVLASCYGASAADRQLLGDAPGQQTRRFAHPVRQVARPNEALAEVGGVNVHAGAAVPSRDRQRRSRLCRYVARPPIAQRLLSQLHLS